MTDETWTVIPTHPTYEASSLGKIRNSTTGALVRQHINQGYCYAIVDKRSRPVHRLVCRAFHGNPPDEKYVPDHLDDDKINNRPENLEWVTRAENTQRAYDAKRALGLSLKHSDIRDERQKQYNRRNLITA